MNNFQFSGMSGLQVKTKDGEVVAEMNSLKGFKIPKVKGQDYRVEATYKNLETGETKTKTIEPCFVSDELMQYAKKNKNSITGVKCTDSNRGETSKNILFFNDLGV